jgi:hypothetical protein
LQLDHYKTKEIKTMILFKSNYILELYPFKHLKPQT